MCWYINAYERKKQSVHDIFYSITPDYPDVKLHFLKHERCLQVIWSSALPKNPRNCDDVARIFQRSDVMQLLGTTKDGHEFYNGAVESDDYSFCVFSSKT